MSPRNRVLFQWIALIVLTIAAYGTARTYAETLGEDHVAGLLQQTLDEEAQTNKLLTEIAMSTVNPSASVNASSVRGNGKSSR